MTLITERFAIQDKVQKKMVDVLSVMRPLEKKYPHWTFKIVDYADPKSRRTWRVDDDSTSMTQYLIKTNGGTKAEYLKIKQAMSRLK